MLDFMRISRNRSIALVGTKRYPNNRIGSALLQTASASRIPTRQVCCQAGRSVPAFGRDHIPSPDRSSFGFPDRETGVIRRGVAFHHVCRKLAGPCPAQAMRSKMPVRQNRRKAFPGSPAPTNPLILKKGEWCPGTESNRRHGDFQSPALPTELPGHLSAAWWVTVSVGAARRVGRFLERFGRAVQRKIQKIFDPSHSPSSGSDPPGTSAVSGPSMR